MGDQEADKNTASIHNNRLKHLLQEANNRVEGLSKSISDGSCQDASACSLLKGLTCQIVLML